MSSKSPSLAHRSDEYRVGTNRLGLWLFIVSDSFVFGALLITRFYLLGDRRPHLEQSLPYLSTR